MNKRIERIISIINSENLDVIAIVPGSNFKFFTGGDFALMERPTVLFIFKDRKPLVILPTLEVDSFAKLDFDADIIEWQDSDGYQDAFNKAKNKIGEIKKIGVEGQRMRYFEYKAIQTSFNSSEILDANKIIMSCRICKDNSEVSSLQKAIDISEKSLKKVLSQVFKGMSEMEIKNLLIQEMYKNGAEGMPFQPIVLISDNSALPHGHSQHKNKINVADALLIDFGCTVDGYNSDITRTFFFQDIKDDHKRIYEAVLKANKIGIDLLKPNASMHEIDDAVLNSLSNSGYQKLIVHKTGHGLGLDVHEDPYIMRKNYDKFKEGMVVTIEPGLYEIGNLGIRIEDDVLLTDKGYRCLTSFSKEIQII